MVNNTSLITLEQYLEMHHHDTANTLNAISYLIMRNNPSDSKKAQDYIEHQKAMEHALYLLARPEDIESKCGEHNLYRLVDIALTRVNNSDTYIQQEIDVDKESKVKTEGALFYRYLYNIISNAKAFAKNNEHNDPNKGRVRIYSKQDNGLVQLSISDNGCGMSPEHIKKISEYGFSTKGTTGLGLAFMDVIMPRINMSYDIEREVGKGTTGLGLAFMDVILPRINMSHDIESEVGKGTTFNLKFNE